MNLLGQKTDVTLCCWAIPLGRVQGRTEEGAAFQLMSCALPLLQQLCLGLQ